MPKEEVKWEILLQRVQRNDTTLTYLDLRNHNLDDARIKELCQVLRVNRTLTALDLRTNKIRNEGAKDLSEVLQTNRILNELNLKHNRITAAGAKALSLALQANHALIALDLSWHRIEDKDKEIEKEINFHLQWNRQLRNQLHQAVCAGNLPLTQQFLARGVSLLSVMGDDNNTPLHWAVSRGHVAVAAWLKKEMIYQGISLGIRNKQGQTAQDMAQHPKLIAMFQQPPSPKTSSMNNNNNNAQNLLAMQSSAVSSSASSAKTKSPSVEQTPKDFTIRALVQRLRLNDPTLTSLELRYKNIKASGVKDLALALKNNHTLKLLDLNGNQIGDAGTKDLVLALKNNHTLKMLQLRNNQIGDEGAKDLSLALISNRTLISLDLSHNQIGDKGVKKLSIALIDNRTLTALLLNDNQIGAVGAKDLSLALKNNHTLKLLQLRNNQIGDEGAIDLAFALLDNRTLISLLLGNNQIGAIGAKNLTLALMVNCTLTSLDLAYMQIEDKMTEQAIKSYLKRNNQSLDQLLKAILQGDTKYEIENYRGAIEEYTHAIRLNPKAGAFLRRGMAHYKLGQLKEAREDYEQAAALNPKLMLDPSFADLIDLVEVDMKDIIDTWQKRGDQFLVHGLYKIAAVCYEKAFELIGMSLEENNDLNNNNDTSFIDSAVEIPEQMRFNLEKYRDLWSSKGLAFYAQGLYQSAIQCFKQALKKDKDMSDNNVKEASILTNIGKAYYLDGQFDEALNYYEKALRHDSLCKNAIIGKGYVLLAWNQIEEAAKLFADALEAHLIDRTFQDCLTLQGQGLIAYHQGQVEEAKEYFRKAEGSLNDTVHLTYDRNLEDPCILFLFKGVIFKVWGYHTAVKSCFMYAYQLNTDLQIIKIFPDLRDKLIHSNEKTVLDLSNKGISNDDIPGLEEYIIKKKKTIIRLNDNTISFEGLIKLAKLIENNPTLQIVELKRNRVSQQQLKLLNLLYPGIEAKILLAPNYFLKGDGYVNLYFGLIRSLVLNKLTFLDLGYMLRSNGEYEGSIRNIGPYFTSFMLALKKNTSVTHLNLEYNWCRSSDTKYYEKKMAEVADMLRVNQGITEINFAGNNFLMCGAIFKAITINNRITKLNLHNCFMSEDNFNKLVECQSLTSLDLTLDFSFIEFDKLMITMLSKNKGLKFITISNQQTEPLSDSKVANLIQAYKKYHFTARIDIGYAVISANNYPIFEKDIFLPFREIVIHGVEVLEGKRPAFIKFKPVSLSKEVYQQKMSRFGHLIQEAMEGNVQTQIKLVKYYLPDNGILRNYERACYWLEQAAAKKNTNAQTLLNDIYTKGRYEKFNYRHEKGFYEPYEMGMMYEQSGCYSLAIGWYEKAVKNNNELAKKRLLLIEKAYFERKSRFTQLFERAEQGDISAQFELTLKYVKGNEGIAYDYEKATHWLKRIIENIKNANIKKFDMVNTTTFVKSLTSLLLANEHLDFYTEQEREQLQHSLEELKALMHTNLSENNNNFNKPPVLVPAIQSPIRQNQIKSIKRDSPAINSHDQSELSTSSRELPKSSVPVNVQSLPALATRLNDTSENVNRLVEQHQAKSADSSLKSQSHKQRSSTQRIDTFFASPKKENRTTRGSLAKKLSSLMFYAKGNESMTQNLGAEVKLYCEVATSDPIAIRAWHTALDAEQKREMEARWTEMLCYCAQNGDVVALTLLLQLPINVSLHNSHHRTALHEAAERGHLECVKKLVEKKAKLFERTSTNQTARDLAKAHSYLEVYHLLDTAMQEFAKNYQPATSINQRLEYLRREYSIIDPSKQFNQDASSNDNNSDNNNNHDNDKAAANTTLPFIRERIIP